MNKDISRRWVNKYRSEDSRHRASQPEHQARCRGYCRLAPSIARVRMKVSAFLIAILTKAIIVNGDVRPLSLSQYLHDPQP